MPVTEPFRITPNLGPDLHQTGPYYWAEISGDISYQLGTKVTGNDGVDYTHVIAGGSDISEGARIAVDSDWVATASGSGDYEAPVAVPAGQPFHARLYVE